MKILDMRKVMFPWICYLSGPVEWRSDCSVQTGYMKKNEHESAVSAITICFLTSLFLLDNEHHDSWRVHHMQLGCIEFESGDVEMH